MALAGSTMMVSPMMTETQEALHIQTSVPLETVMHTQIDVPSIEQIHRDIAESASELSTDVKYEEPNTTSALCNCYKFVDSVVDLPHSSVILNNIGDSGNVAVFYYPRSGLYHYAFVINNDDGSVMIAETNYRHCQYTQRVIRMDYPNLIGFYQT